MAINELIGNNLLVNGKRCSYMYEVDNEAMIDELKAVLLSNEDLCGVQIRYGPFVVWFRNLDARELPGWDE